MNAEKIDISLSSFMDLDHSLFWACLPKVNYFYYYLYRFDPLADFVFEKSLMKHSNKKKAKALYRKFCDSSKRLGWMNNYGKQHAFVKVTFDQKTKRVKKVEVLDVFKNED